MRKEEMKIKGKCKRTVYKLDGSGEIHEIICDEHEMAYRARYGMPCTGPLKCHYCGFEMEHPDSVPIGPPIPLVHRDTYGSRQPMGRRPIR